MPKPVSRRSVLRALGAGMVVGAAAPAISRAYAYRVEVNRHDLSLPNWDADGFKVAFLSDLHMNGESELVRAMGAARMAMETDADVIILGGDYLDLRHPSILEKTKKFLEVFSDASCPVYGVMGNHDYWSGAARSLVDIFARSPVRLLRNDTAEVVGVTIAGVDDAIERRHRYDFFPKGQVSRNLITAFHEPDFVKDMPDHVSLQISGHSHGGQICLPLGISVHTPFGAKNYIDGFYPDAEAPLFVSRGVGTSGPDLRLFCAPEVNVLTLRGAV